MAQKATIHKAELNITDLDRNYYKTHHLTVAQHPSETHERMMSRILCFALHASDTLDFTRGLSTDSEPDLWQKSLSDEIEVWIELGQVDEKRIRQASHHAKQVFIYTYNERSANEWWKQIHNKINRYHNVHVLHITDDSLARLTEMVNRGMQLHITIQDEIIQISNGNNNIEIALHHWM